MKKSLLYIFSIIVLLITPFLGEVDLDFANLFSKDTLEHKIFWDLRVPRSLLAFFVGAILALSGLIFQIIFKNQLITPYTLGIASGTTLFTAISIVFFPTLILSISGVVGSIFTILILYFISRYINKNQIAVSTNTILLIGISLSYFYSSALMLVFYISNLQENYSIVRFTLGSLDTVGFFDCFVVFVFSIILYFVIFKNRFNIKLLLVSNDTAFLKGLNVQKTNITLLVVISLSVGVSISIVGPIGFIGLIVPHIIKLIYKKSAEKLIFPVFFFGGIFLVICDLIARNLNTDSALPIGVVTAFVGAPFFIYLLIRRNKKLN
ncbi:iron complex transport system permease protein [Malaciobacter marinus]|uniref:Iron complex transport system permease protein n=1 Tax=Malaciobacter marinus TaxID=505249 RepID=A0AB36ZZF0_9BACT|nr:iron ABC transporter permease [Malaciobacter marinus]PPK62833.1 iron complex transport system permease protein [Malaciobacter marinus]